MDRADRPPASKIARRAVIVAIVLLVGSPAWGLNDPPHKHFWFWPVGVGLIPVFMGAAGIIQIIANRPMRGLVAAVCAIVLGFAASYAGLLFLLSGAVGRELMF